MNDNELKLMDLATQCGVLIAADEIAQVFGAFSFAIEMAEFRGKKS